MQLQAALDYNYKASVSKPEPSVPELTVFDVTLAKNWFPRPETVWISLRSARRSCWNTAFRLCGN